MHSTSTDIHFNTEKLMCIWNALVAIRRETLADHYHALCSGDWSGFDEGENEVIEKAVKVVMGLYQQELDAEVCCTQEQLSAISDAIKIGLDWLQEGGELSADDGEFSAQLTQAGQIMSAIVGENDTAQCAQLSRPKV